MIDDGLQTGGRRLQHDGRPTQREIRLAADGDDEVTVHDAHRTAKAHQGIGVDEQDVPVAPLDGTLESDDRAIHVT